jgi:hypothetical protein
VESRASLTAMRQSAAGLESARIERVLLKVIFLSLGSPTLRSMIGHS